MEFNLNLFSKREYMEDARKELKTKGVKFLYVAYNLFEFMNGNEKVIGRTIQNADQLRGVSAHVINFHFYPDREMETEAIMRVIHNNGKVLVRGEQIYPRKAER